LPTLRLTDSQIITINSIQQH